uniref:15-oxoprostaglandin 13-reductase n=1 Tax=Strigamia maritima TaxID=126957 RepID=T1JAW1_STRMM
SHVTLEDDIVQTYLNQPVDLSEKYVQRKFDYISEKTSNLNSTMAARMASLPNTFRKLVVKTLTTNFAEATEVVTAQLPKPKANEVLIKNRYLGINATDINITAGRYHKTKITGFVPGLEAVGEIAEVGSDVKSFLVGQPVAYQGFGCFTEYLCVSSEYAWRIPELKPEFLGFLVCGRTALIGLDKVGRIKKGDRVLITAAAGGTGHLAVQYAKQKKCHVVGLCSSDEKEQLVRELGCNRVINYKKENLADVLQEEYPNGIDVVWETVGGDVFNQCLYNLAIRGRLIVVGFITQYKSESSYKAPGLDALPEKLLMSSASVHGFMLSHYSREFEYYHALLLGSFELNRIKVQLDCGEMLQTGAFKGLESIPRAVEHLHTGKSMGKVYVEI